MLITYPQSLLVEGLYALSFHIGMLTLKFRFLNVLLRPFTPPLEFALSWAISGAAVDSL